MAHLAGRAVRTTSRVGVAGALPAGPAGAAAAPRLALCSPARWPSSRRCRTGWWPDPAERQEADHREHERLLGCFGYAEVVDPPHRHAGQPELQFAHQYGVAGTAAGDDQLMELEGTKGPGDHFCAGDRKRGQQVCSADVPAFGQPAAHVAEIEVLLARGLRGRQGKIGVVQQAVDKVLDRLTLCSQGARRGQNSPRPRLGPVRRRPSRRWPVRCRRR